MLYWPPPLPVAIVYHASVLGRRQAAPVDQVVAPVAHKYTPVAIAIHALPTHNVVLEVSVISGAIAEQNRTLAVIFVLEEVARIPINSIYIYRDRQIFLIDTGTNILNL